MKNAIGLELSKQRLALWGMAAAFVVSVPLAAAGGSLGRVPFSEAMEALMTFWTVLGIPGMAVFFGASAGAGLRNEPSASADAPLPLSPRTKAAAALSVAVLYLAAAAALVLVVGPERSSLADLLRGAGSTSSRVFAVLSVLTSVYICLAGFTAAYGTGHGLAGGLLGAVLGGATAVFLAVGFFLWRLLPDPDGEFGRRAVTVIVLALLAGAWAADALVERRERLRNGLWWKVVLAVLCLTCGVFLSSGLAKRSAFELLRRPFLVEPRVRAWSPEGPESRAYSPRIAEVESKGALARALEGSLFWIKPDGSKVKLHAEEPPRLRNFLFGPHWWVDFSTEWDDDGSLWVLLQTARRPGAKGEVCELYHGGTSGRLELHSVVPAVPDPRALVRRGRTLGLLGRQGEDFFFAPLPRKGHQPDWAKAGPADEWKAQSASVLVKEGLSSWAGKDGLLRRTKGSEEGTFLVHAVFVAGKTLFIVPAREKNGSMAWVYEGRRLVQRVWRSPESVRYSLEMAADGTWWGWRDRFSLHLLTREGRFLPPVSVEPALRALKAGELKGMPRVLRMEEGKLWLLAEEGRYLATVDAATGRLVGSWEMPKGCDDALSLPHATAEGFFLDGRKGLFFVGWDGTARKIGWRS